MVNQQILDYIKQQFQQGVSREIISSNLVFQGWQQQDIINAFSTIDKPEYVSKMQSEVPTPESSTQPFTVTTTSQSPESSDRDVTKNKKAIIGLTFGVIGLIAWFISLFGLPITIAGLVFSILGLKSAKRGLAIAGIVLCSIGLLASVVNASIGAYMGATGQNSLVNKYLNKEIQNSQTETTQTVQTDNNSGSKSELINQIVQVVKNQTTLPMQIDQTTKWVDITAEPSAIRYHYILSSIDTNNMTNDSLKNYLSPSICQNEDTKDLLDQDINMEYSYSVENSEEKYFVTLTKTDCK